MAAFSRAFRISHRENKNIEAGIMNRTANNPIKRHRHLSSFGPALLVGALSLTALATPHAAVQPNGVRNSAGTQRLNSEQLQHVQEGLQRNSGFMELRFDQQGALTLGNRQHVQNGSATVRALLIAAVDTTLRIGERATFRGRVRRRSHRLMIA